MQQNNAPRFGIRLELSLAFLARLGDETARQAVAQLTAVRVATNCMEGAGRPDRGEARSVNGHIRVWERV